MPDVTQSFTQGLKVLYPVPILCSDSCVPFWDRGVHVVGSGAGDLVEVKRRGKGKSSGNLNLGAIIRRSVVRGRASGDWR